jgi:hypothetical protein
MRSPFGSNLPPGCTTQDIDRAAGALDEDETPAADERPYPDGTEDDGDTEE